MEIIDNKINICPKCKTRTVKHGFKIQKDSKFQQYRCNNGHILYFTVDSKYMLLKKRNEIR